MNKKRGGSKFSAGWYTDPGRAGYQRYFDGVGWTEHRRPTKAPAPRATAMAFDSPRTKGGAVQLSSDRASDGSKTRRNVLVIVGVLVVVVGVALAFFLNKGEDQKAPAATGSVEEVAKQELPQELAVSSTEVAYFPTGQTGARWSGGAVVGDLHAEDGAALVPIWMPGMEEFNTCELELLEADDLMILNITEAAVDVAAPLRAEGGEAFVLSAVVGAEGGPGDEVHVYLRSLDPQTCEMGSRVEVAGPVSIEELLLSRPQFLGASESVLALAPRGRSYEAAGFDVESQELVWEVSDDEDVGASGDNGAQNVFTTWDGGGGGRWLTAVRDGGALVEGATISDNRHVIGMGNDCLIYTSMDQFSDSTTSYDYVYSYETGESKPLPRRLEGRIPAQGSLDGRGTPVVVGPAVSQETWDSPGFSQSGTYPLGVVVVNDEAEVEDIWTDERMDEAGVSFFGFTNGQVFLGAGDEVLVVNLQGEQIGEALSREGFPYSPVVDFISDGQVWTLWQVEDTDDYAVTKDGVIPERNPN